MNLARPFKAGKMQQDVPRRVATPETGAVFNRRYTRGGKFRPRVKRGPQKGVPVGMRTQTEPVQPAHRPCLLAPGSW